MKNKNYIFLAILFIVSACNPSGSSNSTNSSTPPTSKPPVVKSGSDGLIASGTGIEKEKPESGKGNIQGKVFYNEKPVENIEVKLCETFNRYLGGCGGEVFTAMTDKNGEYLIKNVPPRLYEGLTAKVFDTNYYVFITSSFISAAKYKIEADRTFFAPDTNLFKSDLKILNPPAGAKVAPSSIELKWEAYPYAEYYKFTVSPSYTSPGAKTEYDLLGKRVTGTSYVVDKPLAPGLYNFVVQAYNVHDIKLAESSKDIQFTVVASESAPTVSPTPRPQ